MSKLDDKAATDKTPRQIEIIRCPNLPCLFSVKIGERILGDLEDESIWCGTEAEALAKKAELEREYSMSPEYAASLEKQLNAAVSLPVQTRPPAPKFQHDIDCAAVGDICGVCTCGYEEDHPEDELQYNYPDAPAAPVEQAAPPRPLIREVSARLPQSNCYCEPGKCAAPIVQGQQTPCLDPEKAAAIEQARPMPGNEDYEFCDHCGKIRPECDCHPEEFTPSGTYANNWPPDRVAPAPERTQPQLREIAQIVVDRYFMERADFVAKYPERTDQFGEMAQLRDALAEKLTCGWCQQQITHAEIFTHPCLNKPEQPPSRVRCPHCKELTAMPEDGVLDFHVVCEKCGVAFRVRTSQ